MRDIPVKVKVRISNRPEEAGKPNSTKIRNIYVNSEYLIALKNIKPRQRIYLYAGVRDWDTASVIISFLFREENIPKLIFSWKEDRRLFLRHFYNGILLTPEWFKQCFCQNKKYNYLVIDQDELCSSAWNGGFKFVDGKNTGDRAKYKKMKFDELPPNALIPTYSELIHGKIGNTKSSMFDVTVFLKTISKEASLRSLAALYDYEDWKLDPEKPSIILIHDKSDLPRPERLMDTSYEIIPLIFGLKIGRFKIIDEDAFGLPKLQLSDQSILGFDTLTFREKTETSKLFLELIWGKFSQFAEIKLPDQFQLDRFSQDGGKQVWLMSLFTKIKSYMATYKLKYYTELSSIFQSFGDVIFDLDEENIMDGSVSGKKIFLPNDALFKKIFDFIFAKDIFYSKLIGKDYEEVRAYLKVLAKPIQPIKEEIPTKEDISEEAYFHEETLPMEEQYGEESQKEFDCKKIFLLSENRQFYMFVPLSSKSKYAKLEVGDQFERKYWNYARLKAALKNRPDILEESPDPNLQKTLTAYLGISDAFREMLRDYLFSVSADTVMRQVEEKLEGASGVNYITLLTWLDDIMAPIRSSYPTIEALSKIFSEREPTYKIQYQSFIKACNYIKEQRALFSNLSDGGEDRKIGFKVIKIIEGPFKVRGENVGKLCAFA